MGQRNGQGHVLGRFVRGIAEHHALVAGADLFIIALAALTGFVGLIDALGDIRGLFVQRNQDAAGIAVKAVLGAVIADVDDGLAGDLGDIHIAFRGDLADDMDLTGSDERLAGHAGMGILFQDRIQDSI